MAFVVSSETMLVSAIDTIINAIANGNTISYITTIVANDINLTGANNRTIPYK
jgi:hypothetical protein